MMLWCFDPEERNIGGGILHSNIKDWKKERGFFGHNIIDRWFNQQNYVCFERFHDIWNAMSPRTVSASNFKFPIYN